MSLTNQPFQALGIVLMNACILSALSHRMQEEVLFTINWRNDVTTAHVIRYNGVLWNITHVDTFEGYKGDISLYCKRR